MAFLNSILDQPDPDGGGWTGDPGNIPPVPDPPPAPGGGGQFKTPDVPGKPGGGGVGPMARPGFNFGPTPEFTYNEFTPPSFDEAFNEPGFQFRLRSGSDALERSAAARGVLRTGGTLKDILEYGQNFGAAEYQNAFNRALSTYDRYYQGRKDQYAPRLSRWQLMSQAEIQAALAQYNRETAQMTGGGGGQTYIPPFNWKGEDEGEDEGFY